jgi:3-oxoacyl-[acyl-carrier protein] reductase
MELGIAGRPAVVAAASRGLGYAAALSLAREGARLAICARDQGALEAARDEIAAETGAQVIAIAADVAREEDAVHFVLEGAEALGGCEILVTNAGGPPAKRASQATDEDWPAAIDLNFLSVVRMVRAALPLMRKVRYGRVVAISSLVVKQLDPGLDISTAVRLATTGFLRSLAVEVAGDGITVNGVLPGRILTERLRELARAGGATTDEEVEARLRERAAAVPAGRLGDPTELGDVVAFLASERASYLTGAMIQVDGGLYHGLF